MKPLNYIFPDHVISISPSKAIYGIKKDYITIVKQGFLLIEFTPIIKKNNETIPIWQDKEFYILNPEKALEISHHKLESQNNFKKLFAYNNKTKEISLNKIINKEEESNVLHYKFINTEKNLEFEGKIKEIEFVMIQRMIDYSIPFMMGWHILNTNKIAEEDLINSPD